MSELLPSTVIRTGPVTFRECTSCEGIGDPSCPTCLGTGRITVDVHPFVTLEALAEHVGALGSVLNLGDTWNHDLTYPIGTAGYHLQAVAQASSRLLQQLILLLPEEYDRTEGE